MRSGAGTIRSGVVFSLSREIPTTPSPNNPFPAHHTLIPLQRQGRTTETVDYISVHPHGLGCTHLDAICHNWGDDGLYNGRDPDVLFGPDAQRWADIDQWRTGFVTRGVVVDVPRARGVPAVEVDAPVTGEELEGVLRDQGVAMAPGDALLVHCGRDAWEEANGPYGAPRSSGLPTGAERRPGLHASCIEFIREHDVSLLLWDMLEATPTGYGLHNGTVHNILHAFGVGIVDNCTMGEMTSYCAEAGRYECLLVVSPLRLPGASGCPVNPLAVF
ncbi:MAG: cyclase family protein [Acidimicrobiia bacterium]